ncbi:MAG: ABC transporter ATP-binding protein [Acidobacteria bacterium]|nr:ABC transporter ATP-binding protein [Acidobacteriota bacterium]
MFGMIGPDGAGKSTTLRMVLGLLAPDAGRLRTLGLDPVRRRREVVARTGYLSQRFSLYGDLSVDENIAFFAAVRGVRGWRQRRDELLELVGLAPFRERLADRLSGGMRQKLALACTLIHTPELLVLDEPTTGVDPVSRRELWRVLAGLQREGLAVLVTTPYLDEAERCQRVALIDRGRLLALDTPEALRGGAGAWMLELIVRPRRTAQQLLSARGDVAELASFGERLHVTLTRPPSPELVAELGSELSRAGVAVEALRPITPSLEDVFIARIRTAAGAEEPA